MVDEVTRVFDMAYITSVLERARLGFSERALETRLGRALDFGLFSANPNKDGHLANLV